MHKGYLLKLSKLQYIIFVSDASIASMYRSFTFSLGNIYDPSLFFFLQFASPTNFAAPSLATTKWAVAKSGPSFLCLSSM